MKNTIQSQPIQSCLVEIGREGRMGQFPRSLVYCGPATAKTVPKGWKRCWIPDCFSLEPRFPMEFFLWKMSATRSPLKSTFFFRLRTPIFLA